MAQVQNPTQTLPFFLEALVAPSSVATFPAFKSSAPSQKKAEIPKNIPKNINFRAVKLSRFFKKVWL